VLFFYILFRSQCKQQEE